MNAKLIARHAPPVAVRRIEGPDRVEIRRLAAEGHTPKALALVFPYSVHQITWFLLSKGKGAHLGATGRAAMCADWVTGSFTVGALAEKYDVHRNTVARVLGTDRWARLGLEKPAFRPEARRILTDNDVRAMRAFVAQHGRRMWVYEALAEAYGITPGTARCTALGYVRKDVT